eukprot:TRINITY_DN63589_c0_g1_i1.p1 TRINITY_DN63589_c0_g1~~TRINITY_DN63589_c0_g1_i1.p1  ORF type:complete len:564 (-),score=125.16 TRINITY_DN63589_c0_g1_i1:243-1802(-)
MWQQRVLVSFGRSPLERRCQVMHATSTELSPVHTEFPRAIERKAHIDEEAVETACASLALAVLKGNVDQVEALTVALKTMMPPQEGAQKVRGPPPEATLEKSDLVWSQHDYMSGPQENLRILQRYEAEYARRVSYSEEGFRDPKVLAGALDLAVAYLKNYASDKADAMFAATKPYCMQRGLPWDVKWFQDCATLRCKQQRAEEAAVYLEEVAKRTPPHPATLVNLGTVYNMMRQHEKAEGYFVAAQQVKENEEPDKEDLWYMGITKQHTGKYDEALPMLLKALEGYKTEEPDDDVTIAKLHGTCGTCLDLMGRAEDAVEHFSAARQLYGNSVGADSPLYGSSCESLAKALLHAKRYTESFDRLEEAFLNQAQKDAVHPTPLFELLGLALFDLVGEGHLDPHELERLEAPMEVAVKNLVYRGLDQDGNAGVVFERMAQVLLRCSMAQGDEAHQQRAARRRQLARSLLSRAAPLIEATTRSGEADLEHMTAMITMELQVLDQQDALYRKSLGSPSNPVLGS